jgi:hypothetical protein
MPGGGFLFAKKTAGESSPSFGMDSIVRFARRSKAINRLPYPVSVCPPSSEKIVGGI